jgi:hypothetical protein
VINHKSPSTDIEAHYAKVPNDFPRPEIKTNGVQPLFSNVAYDGRYFPPLCRPSDLWAMWDTFEELAYEVVKLLEADGRMSEPKYVLTKWLARYWATLHEADVGSKAEISWTIRRAAELIGCLPPEQATRLTHCPPRANVESLLKAVIGDFAGATPHHRRRRLNL